MAVAGSIYLLALLAILCMATREVHGAEGRIVTVKGPWFTAALVVLIVSGCALAGLALGTL